MIAGRPPPASSPRISPQCKQEDRKGLQTVHDSALRPNN